MQRYIQLAICRPVRLDGLLVTLMALLLAACATVPPQPIQYESDRFKIRRLSADTTAEALASEVYGNPRQAWMIEQANPDNAFGKGEVVIIPLTVKNKAGLSSEGYQVIPVLCYHRFGNACRSNLCVSEAAFARQLQYLKENDFHVISLSDLLRFIEYETSLPPKSVVITIDDGYRSIYDVAYPLLREYGYTASLFVYTDFIEASANALTWAQLRELKKAGFEIGSHSVTHSDLTVMRPGENEKQFIERVTMEIRESKAIIDQQLNQDTTFFAYPYSNYDARVIKLTQEAGYKLGLTVKSGGNPFFIHPFLLNRNQILEESLDYYISRIEPLQRLELE